MEKKYGGFIVKEKIIENPTLPQDHSQEDGLVARSITSYTNDRVTTVGQRCFQSNSVIEEVHLANVTQVGENAFYGCTNLRVIDMPNLLEAGNGAFANNLGLINVLLPNMQITSQSFRDCTNLETITFGDLQVLGAGCLAHCKKLTKVILLKKTDPNKICTLQGTTTFNGADHFLGTVSTYNPEGLKDGYIYVPDELLYTEYDENGNVIKQGYDTATNWNAFASQLRGLSELE
jgi:hypothetical protein